MSSLLLALAQGKSLARNRTRISQLHCGLVARGHQPAADGHDRGTRLASRACRPGARAPAMWRAGAALHPFDASLWQLTTLLAEFLTCST